MTKDDYWKKREEDWIQANIKSDQMLSKSLKERYSEMMKSIENDINRFYINYANKDHISMDEAIKKVASFDVKAFQDTAKKMVENKDFSEYANERLRAYNATMRINRLEMLKSKIGEELVNVDASVEKDIRNHLTNSYQNEATRQAGILGDNKFDGIKGKVDKVIDASFQGATWSQRLWVSHIELKSKIDGLLTRSLIQGQNPKTLVKDLMPLISKNVDNRRFVAERLAITETSRVQDQAQMDTFKRLGFEYVRWVAEPTACDECVDIAAENDGIYSVDKVPAIPVHPMCRCSKAATMDKPQVAEKEINSGALHGALNDDNDPYLEKRTAFANKFYESLRNSNRSSLVGRIVKSSGVPRKEVNTALSHILDKKYELQSNNIKVVKRFDPSYDMAQSLQRLNIGKPEKHDIIMLKHESLEYKYMNVNGLAYNKAHALANKEFDYYHALLKWKGGK